jgi:hypothetical protein
VIIRSAAAAAALVVTMTGCSSSGTLGQGGGTAAAKAVVAQLRTDSTPQQVAAVRHDLTKLPGVASVDNGAQGPDLVVLPAPGADLASLEAAVRAVPGVLSITEGTVNPAPQP